MRVLALTKYDSLAASTRQRFLLYFPWLERHGITVDVAPLMGNDRFAGIGLDNRPGAGYALRSYARRLRQLLGARRYDLLWISYELFPWLPGPFERLVRLTGVPYVLDYDDATFHAYDSNANPLIRLALGNKLQPLMRGAAACVCGNAYLESYAARFCRETIVVPTVIDTDRYQPAPPAARPDPPVLGWIGSPSTWRNVEPLLPALLPLLARRGSPFHAIGAGPRSRGIEGVTAIDWSEAGEIPELQRMSVGIMPLLDLPFERGKCGYKLIQYLGCGLPVVASPVGVNVEIVERSGAGFVASSPGEWSDALTRLLDDPGLRARLGESGRKAAVEHYSLATHAPRVQEVLERAAAAR